MTLDEMIARADELQDQANHAERMGYPDIARWLRVRAYKWLGAIAQYSTY